MKRTAILAAAALTCMLGGAVTLSLADHVPFGLALFWSVETASTVGYGDVSLHGGSAHVIAVAVMLTSIPLLGATFASLTAAHVHRHIGKRLDRHLKDMDRALARTERDHPETKTADSRHEGNT